MTLYEALKTKLFESVYDPFDNTLLDPNNGQRVDVNQAVKRSMLGHNTCVVYDTEKSRQVMYIYSILPDVKLFQRKTKLCLIFTVSFSSSNYGSFYCQVALSALMQEKPNR